MKFTLGLLVGILAGVLFAAPYRTSAQGSSHFRLSCSDLTTTKLLGDFSPELIVRGEVDMLFELNQRRIIFPSRPSRLRNEPIGVIMVATVDICRDQPWNKVVKVVLSLLGF